ncbi:MAG: ATP-binding protein [Actinobacteria bacterium]|nr:ATP-binding protein [Actinomycetota bacterium]
MSTDLEADVRSYLRQRGKCLMISGPSKMGKTVLVEHLVPRDAAVWISGDSIISIEAFWQRIIDQLDAYRTVEQSYSQEAGGGAQVEAFVGMPEALGARASIGGSGRLADTYSGSTTRSAESTALEYFQRDPVPIVIDDFHYTSETIREPLTMAIKQLILHTRVILIAVPHEAFALVRSTSEMNGRVWQVQVPEWEHEELELIATEGFQSLGVIDPENVSGYLAEASLSAPFLMQQLCFDLLESQGIESSSSAQQTVHAPEDWSRFFRRIARRHEPDVFAALASGPPVRGEPRSAQLLKDGTRTDIYGAVLLAIGRSGKRQLHYLDVADSLASLATSSISNQRIGSALKQLSSIAWDKRGQTDPALAYKDDTVTILDPFLAFYLQHGDWVPPTVRERPSR